MGSEIADPIPEYIYRCKKASLLNSLKDELHNTPLIHERMLHKLEFLEELDYRIGSPVSPSFSAAYCAVAVECTLMHLSAHSSDDVISTDSAYVKAINRIWRDHISYMESSSSSGVGCQLYNAELKWWSDEIEASLSDPCVLKRLESYNSKEDAISKLKGYLVEASQDLAAYFLAIAFFTASHADTCPTSVESVRHKQEASKLASLAVRLHLALQRDLPFGNQSTELPNDENQTEETLIENQNTEALVENLITEEAPSEFQTEEARTENRITEEAPNETKEAPTENQITEALIENPITEDAPNENQTQESLNENQATEVLIENLINEVAPSEIQIEEVPFENQTTEALIENQVTEEAPNKTNEFAIENQTTETPIENQITEEQLDENQAKEVRTENQTTKVLIESPITEEAPTENRTEEALIENKTTEALIENLITEVRPSEIQIEEATLENQTTEALIENQITEEALDEDKTKEAASGNLTTEALIENQINENQSKEAPIHKITDVPTGNVTADTDLRDQYAFAAASAEECNESERGLHEGASDHATKIQLPSPKGWKISPLRKYEERNIIMRRKKKRWSELEVETLRSAVNQHGEGNWKLILSAHMDVFEERTDVDLKDKWRNIKRHRAN